MVFVSRNEQWAYFVTEVCDEDFDGEEVNYWRGRLMDPENGYLYLCISSNLKYVNTQHWSLKKTDSSSSNYKGVIS